MTPEKKEEAMDKFEEGQPVRVRHDVENTDQYDGVEEFAGIEGTVAYRDEDGTYVVHLGEKRHEKWFYEHELEAVDA